MWAVQVEEVRVACNGGAQESVCAIFPFIAEVGSVDGLETHGCHATSDNVETCGEGNDVEFDFFAVGHDTLFCEALDRCAVLFVDVYDGDVISVEDFVEVLLETWTLDTEWVGFLFWEKDLLLLWVLDAGGLLLAPEVVGNIVSLVVGEVVLVPS